MKRQNLITKYGVTDKEIENEIETTLAKHLGEICNSRVLMAVTDLLANGDIPPEED
ncbi:MAG: hypothetical protein ACK5KR_09070 [Breznakia sp.]